MSDFWEHIKQVSAAEDHRLALIGKQLASCAPCNGTGHSEPGRSDWDAHGSYWVSPVDCRNCGGRGRVEVACTAETKAAAVKTEIARLRAELRLTTKRPK